MVKYKVSAIQRGKRVQSTHSFTNKAAAERHARALDRNWKKSNAQVVIIKSAKGAAPRKRRK